MNLDEENSRLDEKQIIFHYLLAEDDRSKRT